MNNVIFSCLTESTKEFVTRNARRDEDVLPLCTYVRQLEAAGRERPRNEVLNDRQLERIRSCYHLTVPEPGSSFGIMMCKSFLQPRQQNNFDIKKPRSFVEKENDIDWSFYSNAGASRDVQKFMATSKCEMLLSTKSASIVYMSFALESKDISNIEIFKTKILKKILPYSLCICVKEMYKNETSGQNEIHFVAYAKKTIEDHFLQALYELSDCESIKLIFTSDRSFFADRDLNIINCINFLYCFLTDRYKPEKENDNDDICLYMVKLIATITFEIGGKSLKRNGLSKCGIGPLAFVISEAGILETAKINGTFEYPVDGDDIAARDGLERKRFYINSSFERMFLNLPVRNGILFPDFQYVASSSPPQVRETSTVATSTSWSPNTIGATSNSSSSL